MSKREGAHLPIPSPVIDYIFDELNILDRCCLALCNRALLNHAVKNEHLHYLLNDPPSRKDLQDFFERRLGRGWVGNRLRYCGCCGLFVSIQTIHWRLISERWTRERSGSIADLWRARRDDGWLRYWIERWCSEPLDMGHWAASAIRKEDRTRLLCPKCAILDTENNDWRCKISGG